MRFLLLLPFLLTLGAAAQEAPSADPAAQETQDEGPFAGLAFETGSIELPKEVARLELPEGYRYLGTSDTKTALESLFGKPPATMKGLQGMVVPPRWEAGGPAGWVALLIYAEDGHISDDEMASLDPKVYMDYLKTLDAENNKKLKAKGQPVFELMDWISQPSYNPELKIFSATKRYWNEEGRNGEKDTVEGEYWVLGRRGRMVVRAISTMGGPGAMGIFIKSRGVPEMIQFTSGNRHEDFDPKTDKRAYLLPAKVELAAAGAQAKSELWRSILRKLPFLLIILPAVLLKRWFDKIREASA